MIKKILVGVLIFVVTAGVGLCAIPGMMNYQGRLTNSTGSPIKSARTFQFKIYDSLSGGSVVWTSHSYTITPDSNGVFSAVLGSNDDEITSAVFSSANRYLELVIEGETLSPRIQLVTSAYAYKSADSDYLAGSPASEYYKVAGGTITGNVTVEGTVKATSFIGDGSQLTGVSASGISDNAVTSSKIVAGAVTSAKLATGSVTADAIADASVTDAKIVTVSGSKVVGTVLPGPHASSHYYGSSDALAVSTNMIDNSAITATKLASNINITTTGSIDVSGTARIAEVLTMAQNSDATLTSADFGKTITVSSGSDQIITLPSIATGAVGATITIVKLGAGKVTLRAATDDKIADSVAGGTIYDNAASETYANLTIQAVANHTWVVIGGHGTWTTQ